MSSFYKFVDTLVELSISDDFFEKFISEIVDNTSIKIDIHSANISNVFGIECIDMCSEKILRDAQYGDIVYAENDWMKIELYPSANPNPDKAVLLSAVYSYLCFQNVLLCHSSLIDYNGRGILFMGPSGVGKTTQSELWKKYKGAEIINGDKAFIKMEDDNLRGYGSPWRGSSEYCLNRDVLINAVVILRQDGTNSIRRLTNEEKLSLFVPHIFLPHWDENCMKSALETLDKVLNTVPVYLLKCRPDENAVKLTEATVLG